MTERYNPLPQEDPNLDTELIDISHAIGGICDDIVTNQENIETNQENIETNQENIVTNQENIAELFSYVEYYIDWDSLLIVQEDDTPVGGVMIGRNTRKQVNVNTIPTPNGDTLDNYSYDVSSVIYKPILGEWSSTDDFIENYGATCRTLYDVGVAHYLVFQTGRRGLNERGRESGGAFTSNIVLDDAYMRAKIVLKRRIT